MESKKQLATREATACHEKRGRGELAARAPTIMKKFSFRCISCGCIATVALSLPLIAAAGTNKTRAAHSGSGGQTGTGSGGSKGNKSSQGNSQVSAQSGGSGSQGVGSKKVRRSSQGTNLAGTQSGRTGGKKGKTDLPDPNRAGTNAVRFPGAAAAASDLRVKNNISFVGWSPMGIPIYRFSYITEPNKRYQGTIAQAIIPIRPDAVILQNGLMFVDYSRLDIAMEELPPPSGSDQ